MGVVGVTFVALYAGINSGFYTIQLTRDDIRATQIIADKLDTIRLYAWDTVIQPGFVPTNFVESFYPTSVTNGAGYSSPGVTYSGSISITAAPLTESYSTNMRLVTVTVNWTTAKLQRQRSATTLITKNGLQRFIY